MAHDMQISSWRGMMNFPSINSHAGIGQKWLVWRKIIPPSIKSGYVWHEKGTYRQLKARRALSLFKDVPLRSRRALSPWTLYSDSTLLVLNGTSLNIDSALLALNWRYPKPCHLMSHNIHHNRKRVIALVYIRLRGVDFGYFCARVPVLIFRAGPGYPRLANYTKK